MKTTKYGRYLTTVPVIVWWLADYFEKIIKKRGNKNER